MLDIESLREQLEEASAYKEDLFDFYNRTWPKLIAEVERLRAENVTPRELRAEDWEF